MNTSSATAVRPFPGRLLLILGVLLPFAAIGAYIAQVATLRLSVPWYMPGLATVGLLCVLVALSRRFTIVRCLALILVCCVTALTWGFIFLGRVPAYTGSITNGTPFPEFVTTTAEGKPFTQEDFRQSKNTVLVFFRGRW